VLDGQKSAASLDAAERVRLALLEQAVAEAVAPVLAEPTPDLSDAVMARVAATPIGVRVARPGRAGWIAALWKPTSITLRVRPLAVAAVVALLVPLGIATARRASAPATSAPATTVAGPADPQLYVQFQLEDPSARSVALAGSFTGWAPRYQLHETAPGVWSILVPVAPGVHQYAFVVDGGRWMPDPRAPSVDDGFGGSNSQLSVLPPSASL
jgi:hypothetical protein